MGAQPETEARMPNWGVTSTLLPEDPSPWGIDHGLLRPGKTLTDPVHGDIYLNRLETQIVNSWPMQRLGDVLQLGTTHLVYRGATHTRLSHSLGTLRATQDLLDAVWNSRFNPQAQGFDRHLMEQWTAEGSFDDLFAEATVLARLGGLMHDLCHIPLGHTIEDDLRVLKPHDLGRDRFDHLWELLPESVRTAIPNNSELKLELERLILSKNPEVQSRSTRFPFVADIVGNTICADLMDYIRRDHLFTGLPLALGRRFMDSFFVVERDHPYFAQHMVIGIERDGRVRNDVVTELLKYLRYRYELTERVLTHHAKTAADAMLGSILEEWRDHLWYQQLAQVSLPEGYKPDPSKLRSDTIADLRDRGLTSKVLEGIDRAIASEIENEFLTRSDADIIGHIERIGNGSKHRRLKRAGRLAGKLRRRELHKAIGLATGEENRANAEKVYETWGSADARRTLERGALSFAGLPPDTELLLWVPNHDMRLKVANVLVRKGDTIAPLAAVESKSEEIARQHQNLWCVSVYGSKIPSDKAAMVVSYISQRTALEFHRPDGTPIPSCIDLVIETLVRDALPFPGLEDELRRLPQVRDLTLAARTTGDPQSFAVLKGKVLNAAIQADLLPKPSLGSGA